MIVELQDNMWITECHKKDSPFATAVKSEAKDFNTMDEAVKALSECRKYGRPFPNAVIEDSFI